MEEWEEEGLILLHLHYCNLEKRTAPSGKQKGQEEGLTAVNHIYICTANGGETTCLYKRAVYRLSLVAMLSALNVAESKGEGVSTAYTRVIDSTKTLPLALIDCS